MEHARAGARSFGGVMLARNLCEMLPPRTIKKPVVLATKMHVTHHGDVSTRSEEQWHVCVAWEFVQVCHTTLTPSVGPFLPDQLGPDTEKEAKRRFSYHST